MKAASAEYTYSAPYCFRVRYKKGMLRMKRRKRLKAAWNILIWFIIIWMGCSILFRAAALPVGQQLLENAERFIGDKMLRTLAPAAGYAVSYENQETLFEKILSAVSHAIPVQAYFEEGYSKTAENDPSYEKYLDSQSMTSDELYELLKTEESLYEASLETSETETDTNENSSETDNQTETSLAEAGRVADAITPAVIGTEYSIAKLNDYDFLIRNFYSVSEITTITSSELNAERLLSIDMSMQGGNDEPQILIYHTHSQEEFSDSRPGESSDCIVGVGTYLARLLREQYGYNVIHNTAFYDVKDGVTDRNKAYTYAEEGISRILEENPSIELVIDLHRDGVNEGVHLVTEVNGKPTAQIMFVNGISKTSLQGKIDYLENPYIEENLAFSLQLQLKAKAYYPDYTRRIMIKAYRYNMHYRPKSLLIEVGAQTNTLEEAMNAMEPLAVMLHEVLK